MLDLSSCWLPIFFFILGLHLPKSFTLYYLLLLVLAWLGRKNLRPSPFHAFLIILLLLFGFFYSSFSVYHGFWEFDSKDILDIISVTLLPALGVLIGSSLNTRLGWRSMASLIFAYGLGSLVFALLAILLGRVLPSHGDLTQFLLLRRSSTSSVPWGNTSVVNIRSIEQNASIAISLFCPGIYLFLTRRYRFLSLLFIIVSLLGFFVAFVFHGRLLYLMPAVGVLPLLLIPGTPIVLFRKILSYRFLLPFLLVLSIALSKLSRNGLFHYFYDERFDRFLGFFRTASSSPWGGGQLSFNSYDRVRQVLMPFDASHGDLMHNVLMDVYVRVGWIPAFLLLFSVSPLVWQSFKAVQNGLRIPFQQPSVLLLASSALCLTVQWLFQPLLYADGLLFYVGFLLLGFLASKHHELQP